MQNRKANHCMMCGTACFAHAGHDPICVDCYIPENPTFGWKVRRWMETKNGKAADLRRFATASQKEAFLNRELGLKIKKTKKKETAEDR